MTISNKDLGVKDSILDIVGRDRKTDVNGYVIEDWLLVSFNGNVCKVGAGFFRTVDMNFTMPKQAVIRHLVVDEKSRDERLRFPIFINFIWGD